MRKLPVVIFVVDDVEADARFACGVLNDSLKMASKAFLIDEGLQFEFDVVPIFPRPSEFADEFEARFERILRLQDADTCAESARLQAALFDLAFELSARSTGKPTSGERLAGLARQWRPNVPRYGLTSLRLSGTSAAPQTLLKTPFKKEQLLTEASAAPVARQILADLEKRFATPVWDGLIKFSKLSKVPMHAMASSEARNAETSLVVDPFLNLLGSTYYQIEATSTKFPLDSLLEPSGVIKQSQDLAARTFGAKDAHFVTNGTSTANKIVYSALVGEGDFVLLYECCHISHHISISLTGAAVKYIRPEPTQVPGVPGQVTPQSIVDALDSLLATHPDSVLPRIISVTNCTFDGFLIDPKAVVLAILECLNGKGLGHRINEITFLFDEAWFSFGYFHPEYVRFSAMAAANELKSGDNQAFWTKNLNVIATQSLHKTGFALRQASIILKNLGTSVAADPRANVAARFSASRKMFTTTSPSMPILASIDWARRQLDIEGCFLVEAAHDAVGIFRDAYGSREDDSSIFLEPEVSSPDATPKDRTKVTVRSTAVSGKALRDQLWGLESAKIQVNKFASDSVLMMFMPGFTDRSSALLRAAMDELIGASASGVSTASAPGAPPPSLADAQFISRSGGTSRYPDALRDRDGFVPRRGAFVRDRSLCTTVIIDKDLIGRVASGKRLYSLEYVIPYPPGFPILIPSQLITVEILDYLMNLDHGEIHGLSHVAGGYSISVLTAET